MTSWALLIRGINVGGRNTLAMADLRALLTDLGHRDVRTFLNSGNATFTSRRSARAAMTAEVEDGAARAVRARTPATIRTLIG